MRSFLVFVFFIVAVVADFGFQGNLSLANGANSNNDYKYRNSQLTILDVLDIEGVYFESDSVVNGTNQQDTVAGAFFVFPIDKDPPTAFLSFFSSYSNYLNVKTANLAQLDLQTADSLISKTFVSLDEVNTTSNATVNTINFLDLTWTLLQANAPATPVPFLSYVSLKGTNPKFGANFSVTITAVFSQVLGLLNVVGAPVITPKSLETVVNISYYPYSSTANALRLNLVIGTGQVNVSVQGSVSVVSGSGNSSNYAEISNQAQVNGNTGTVTINVLTQSNGTTGSNLADAQLTLKYSTQRTVTKVSVQFPPGVANIVYDPTIGTGVNPQTLAATAYTGNSAGTSLGSTTSKTGNANQYAPIFALLFLIVAVLF